MPSIDELLALPLESLKALTDEQLLETYKDCFRIESAAIEASPSTDDSNDDAVKPKSRAKKKDNGIASLKLDLFNMAELEAQLKKKIAEKQQATTTPNKL